MGSHRPPVWSLLNTTIVMTIRSDPAPAPAPAPTPATIPNPHRRSRRRLPPPSLSLSLSFSRSLSLCAAPTCRVCLRGAASSLSVCLSVCMYIFIETCMQVPRHTPHPPSYRDQRPAAPKHAASLVLAKPILALPLAGLFPSHARSPKHPPGGSMLCTDRAERTSKRSLQRLVPAAWGQAVRLLSRISVHCGSPWTTAH